MRFVLFGILGFAVAGCGGAGSSSLNSENAVISVDASGVTLQTNDIDQTFTLDPDLDRGAFAGASAEFGDDSDIRQTLYFSQGDQSFAALLATIEDGSSADTFFDLNVETPTFPEGSAALTGSYVGLFVGDGVQISGPIEGLLTLSLDFDEMTLNGSVTDRTILFPVFGTELPFVLNEELNIVFPEMRIGRDGVFSGRGERDVPSREDPDNVAEVTTEVFGALTGSTVGDLEAVGSVSVEAVSNGAQGISTVEATTREVGVFAIGHN